MRAPRSGDRQARKTPVLTRTISAGLLFEKERRKPSRCWLIEHRRASLAPHHAGLFFAPALVVKAGMAQEAP